MATACAFVGRLRIVAQFFSFLVLVLGAWFTAQGAMLHSVLALLIGGFNLIVVTRRNLQAASRFFLLVPGVFGFIIGAITLGGIAGLWAQNKAIPPIMVLVGLSYMLAGLCTVLWLLLMPPSRPRPELASDADEGEGEGEGEGE